MDEQINQEAESVKRKPRKTIPVTVISNQGKMSMIEWLQDGRTMRGSVPIIDVIDGNSVYMETLEQAVLYGLDFQEFETPITSEWLEQQAHKVGIWTSNDVLVDRPALNRLLDVVKREYLQQLINFAKSR